MTTTLKLREAELGALGRLKPLSDGIHTDGITVYKTSRYPSLMSREKEILEKLSLHTTGVPSNPRFSHSPATGKECLEFSYSEGIDLCEYIHSLSSFLSSTEIKDIFTKIADVILVAHSFGIFHRDLKPENIIYDPKTGHVTIIDWEFAAYIEEKVNYASGTGMYAAPEIYSDQHYGPVNDVWSLGVILYILSTKAFPIPEKDGKVDVERLLAFDVDWNNGDLLPSIKRILKKVFVKYDARVGLEEMMKDAFFTKG